MSLINKMLQDLDARGTPAAESFPSQIRPVAHERHALAARFGQRSIALAAGGAAAACVAVALAWFGWGHLQQSRSAHKPPAAAGAAVASTAPAAIKPAPGLTSTIKMGPASANASAPLTVPPTAQPKSVVPFEPDSDDARAARQAIMAELQARMTAGGAPAPGHASKQASSHEAQHESKHASKHASKAEPKPEAKRLSKKEERRERRAALLAQASADTDTTIAAAAKGKRATQGRQESASQRAEGEYRRALVSLQDGRMTETVAALEQALKLDPGHDAARQTLVGLLIEAKRTDEAIRHLQAGLAIDARQPALAMLLARLQIERGGSGIETLTRTLPYAGNHADYHAFLAGALEREQRHREAAEQYQAALRTAPGNGVWWMGLGMALQADKRNAEALEAFQRARASGTLSPELQAFVERRLQQLGR
jgi:MSHA biogenesis protein MshN